MVAIMSPSGSISRLILGGMLASMSAGRAGGGVTLPEAPTGSRVSSSGVLLERRVRCAHCISFDEMAASSPLGVGAAVFGSGACRCWPGGDGWCVVLSLSIRFCLCSHSNTRLEMAPSRLGAGVAVPCFRVVCGSAKCWLWFGGERLASLVAFPPASLAGETVLS